MGYIWNGKTFVEAEGFVPAPDSDTPATENPPDSDTPATENPPDSDTPASMGQMGSKRR